MRTVERVTNVTPDDVTVDVTLCGVGTRTVAAVVDLVIQLFLLLAALVLLGLVLVLATVAAGGDPTAGGGVLPGVFVAVFAFTAFAVLFGYHTVTELRWGASPGKRIFGVRVTTDGGLPPTTGAIVLRNLLRVIDYVPPFVVIDVVAVLTSSRRMRVGDVFAGTLVVRPEQPEPGLGPLAITPRPPEETATWDTSALSDDDELLVRRFLARRRSLTVEARAGLAHALATRVWPSVTGAPAGLPPEYFLEGVVLAASQRHAGQQTAPARPFTVTTSVASGSLA